jgi:putative ABC transport system permease protein
MEMSYRFKLAFKLALREMRAGLKGFRIFIACLALGVAAIGGVGSLSEAIKGGLEKDARRLLGGDVALRLTHMPATSKQKIYLAKSGILSEVVEMRAMAHSVAKKKRTLVELKGVDELYPLVGKIEIGGDKSLKKALSRQGGVWGAIVETGVFPKLGLELGDHLRVGEAEFAITGIILKEPDRIANLWSLGPRIMVSSASLPETGLIQPGSQIRFHYRVLLRDTGRIGDWIEGLKLEFPSAGWRIRSLEQATPGLKRFIDYITLFLTFVGLTTLLVGGIGVSNAVGSYLEGKVGAIAISKCLGASGNLIFFTYFMQLFILAGIGIVIGTCAGALLPAVGAWVFNDMLPVKILIDFFPLQLLMAALFGILITFTFAIWPIARARAIPAASLFRDKVAPSNVKPEKVYILYTIFGGVALSAMTILFSVDRRFSMWFVIGAVGSLLLLSLCAMFLKWGAKRLKKQRSTKLSLALNNLHRPGASTNSVVLSLGLGLAVLVAIALIESNLTRQVDDQLPDMAPAFFFIDIQPNQVASFDKVVGEFKGVTKHRRVPSLRGRIVKIAGKTVGEVKIATGAKWAVRGDRALTYTATPSEGTKIVAGKWWPPDYTGKPLISLDANLAKGFGVDIGDTLTLNILGKEIEAKITSLREIDWRSLRFDFAIIFAPGTLERAPHSYLAAIQLPERLEAKIERTVGDNFKNVSIIRVREALKSAANILAGIGDAVRGISIVTILSGLLVLAGAISAGRKRRIYDAVVLKVLGATRTVVLQAFLLEYCILGAATGLTAAVIGTVAAWGVASLLMGIPWYFEILPVLGTILLCIFVTLVAGFYGTWRAMGQKASPLLRNE